MKFQDLADASGISAPRLRDIAQGSPMTSTERLYLAAALGVGVDDLENKPERDADLPPAARRTAAWFRHFVDDAMFVDRTARRYGIK